MLTFLISQGGGMRRGRGSAAGLIIKSELCTHVHAFVCVCAHMDSKTMQMITLCFSIAEGLIAYESKIKVFS